MSNKKKIDSEELIKLALRNLSEDREKVNSLYEKIMNGLTSGEMPEGIAVLAVAENATKLVDSLTKQNSQIVDLAKLKAKELQKELPDEEMGDDEVDDLYDEMSSSEEIRKN